ncbi:hypothetical protein FC52_GL000994 [Lactobacillus pasteurii DSM 23907 = CRBIP 24.76]|uniref:Uncharacterized protein n=1 Tax=Lactobacillus pasteurii DSM 23907 = CRBIP 24.76 TaxID=1423790 RepID=I7IZ87_9LACO|nr:hypothetical protein [Lactobacillus pasteurii]KRK08257.1 hypothetical protein FC52_GL000994 [Lactobacillus pasteurii DSM 23907 = CRBIP 24.76]TDG77377.1 hypothetical protein C5L33_000820 [Lactobacillus pasteurii]CCI84922.1 Protein of unknown function [Lactobacillus pasteurii DSM 23907 = CRBIP 24.76]
MKKRTVIATLPLLSAAILGGVAESTTTNYVQARKLNLQSQLKNQPAKSLLVRK